MKNWAVWIDNITFLLAFGVIVYFKEINLITGISEKKLFFLAAILIVISATRSFSKLLALLKKLKR
jgi:hypothetical protein